jgi:hypothetical protein
LDVQHVEYEGEVHRSITLFFLLLNKNENKNEYIMNQKNDLIEKIKKINKITSFYKKIY